MAEIEFSALWTECLDRRIPDAATLRPEIDDGTAPETKTNLPSTGSS
jgi:hypothetical protein